MTRACLLAAVLAAGCTDAPPPPPGPAATTAATATASPTPTKPLFKEPDPEIR